MIRRLMAVILILALLCPAAMAETDAHITQEEFIDTLIMAITADAEPRNSILEGLYNRVADTAGEEAAEFIYWIMDMATSYDSKNMDAVNEIYLFIEENLTADDETGKAVFLRFLKEYYGTEDENIRAIAIKELQEYFGSGVSDGDSPSAQQEDKETSAFLPDPYYFFHEELAHSERSVSGGTEIEFFFAVNGADAAYEYVELLRSGRFPVQLEYTTSKAYSGDMSYYYSFSYIGSEEVGTVSGTTYPTLDMNNAMIVQLDDWSRYGYCSLVLWVADGLSFSDSGDRSTRTSFTDKSSGSLGPVGGVAQSSGGGGNSNDSDSDSGSTHLVIQCNKCFGKGKVTCSNCNGKGNKEKYVSSPNYSGSTKPNNSGVVQEKCLKCNGTGELTCSACDGKGKK